MLKSPKPNNTIFKHYIRESKRNSLLKIPNTDPNNSNAKMKENDIVQLEQRKMILLGKFVFKQRKG